MTLWIRRDKWEVFLGKFNFKEHLMNLAFAIALCLDVNFDKSLAISRP